MQAETVQAEAQSRSSQIIRNVLMNWTAFGSTVVVGFMLSPFLVRHLGDATYGVWVLVGSLVGYLGLLDFGLTPSIVKYVAEHRARDDREAINRLVTAAFAVYSSMGLLALAISFTVAYHFNDIFHTPLSRATTLTVGVIAGLNLALSFPAAVFVGVVRGCQRYDLDASVTSLTILVRSAAVVAAVLNGYGVVGLAACTLTFDLIRLAYLVRWAFKLVPGLRLAPRYFDRQVLRQLFHYSVFVFVIIVSKQIVFYTDSIIIGVFLSTSMVTVYSIAARLVSYLRMLVEEMVGVLAPTTSDLDARNDHDGMRELLVLSTKYMLLLALPVATVFFALGDTFIALWMGPQYTESARILAVLTVASLAHLLEMPAYTALLGRGKHRIAAAIMIGQATANLALSLVLVGRYGLMGVALGTAIPMIASTTVALLVYFRYHLNIRLWEYLRRSVPLPVLVQAPFVAAVLLIRAWGAPTSLLLFFGELALALVPYGLIAFTLCLSPRERRPFLRLAEKFGLKLSPRFS